jgi:hypothetical protein
MPCFLLQSSSNPTRGAPGIRVFLPSYRRLDQLRWSILSVLRAGEALNSELNLVVISNYPPVHVNVRSIIGSVLAESPSYRKWNIFVIEREVTIDPVDNWYGAIREHSQLGETIFLHGDDDVFLPHGISIRHQALLDSNAVLAISHNHSGLIFIDSERCYAPSPCHIQGKTFEQLSLASKDLSCAAFIGNHAYRFGPEFLDVLDHAFSWCDAQSWLTRQLRTLMLPYYLPLACLALRKPAILIPECCEVRGMELEEITHSRYGSRGWNSPFLYGITLDILHNADLRSHSVLNSERKWYGNAAARGWTTILDDPRMSWAIKRRWLTIVFPLIGWRMIFGVRGLVTWVLFRTKLKAWVVVRKCRTKRTMVRTKDWLDSLTLK